MLYMVIESFRAEDVPKIYQRLAEKGRMMPEGLRYVNSWITTDQTRCYQVMETDDERLLREWAAHWADVFEFEIIPVVHSSEMQKAHAQQQAQQQ
jgi:hypothetical protein